MYYEKLQKFVKAKGLKQKEFADIMGYSANMISRYFAGTAEFNAEFIMKFVENFPEVDLNEIFSKESENTDLVEEPSESYNFNVITEIEEIEKKIAKIKAELARKSHG